MIKDFKLLLTVHDHETNRLRHFERESHLLDRLEAARAALLMLVESDATRPELKGLLKEMAEL